MTDVLEQTPPEPLPAPAGAHRQRLSRRSPAGSTGSRTASARSLSRAGSPSASWWASVVFTLAQLHPDLLFSNTTPTGGDMGAHVWGPAYLRDHLLPHFRLSGWAPDWYAGFPMYQFYMVIPALAVVLVNLILLPYGLALKLVSIAGVLTLPIAVWAFGKLSGLQLPGAGALRRAVGDLPLRRELHDLRREHRVDDGGRVLVLDRAVARVRLLRSARPRVCAPDSPARSRPCCWRCACCAT